MRAGRWQARFTVPFGHPSGRGGRTVTAPHTFEPTTYGKEAAGDWLRDEERRLNAEGAAWATLAELAEAERAGVERESVVTFGEYSAVWLRCLAPLSGSAGAVRPATDPDQPVRLLQRRRRRPHGRDHPPGQETCNMPPFQLPIGLCSTQRRGRGARPGSEVATFLCLDHCGPGGTPLPPAAAARNLRLLPGDGEPWIARLPSIRWVHGNPSTYTVPPSTRLESNTYEMARASARASVTVPSNSTAIRLVIRQVYTRKTRHSSESG